MQLQALLLSVLVTMAAAAPVAEPQRGVPDGGCRLAIRDPEPQRGVNPGGCRLAIRDADPQKRFGGGRDLVSRNADPQVRWKDGGRPPAVRNAEPGRTGPSGPSGGSGLSERATVSFRVSEPRGVRGGRPGSNGR